MAKRPTLIDIAIREIDRKIDSLNETKRQLLDAVDAAQRTATDRRRARKTRDKVAPIAAAN